MAAERGGGKACRASGPLSDAFRMPFAAASRPQMEADETEKPRQKRHALMRIRYGAQCLETLDAHEPW